MADALNIGGLGAIRPTQTPETSAAPKADGSFKDILMAKIGEVNDLQQQAESAMSNFAAGKTENVSEVLVAVQKADLAFKTLMGIRNKLFEAYQEINQLRI